MSRQRKETGFLPSQEWQEKDYKFEIRNFRVDSCFHGNDRGGLQIWNLKGTLRLNRRANGLVYSLYLNADQELSLFLFINVAIKPAQTTERIIHNLIRVIGTSQEPWLNNFPSKVTIHSLYRGNKRIKENKQIQTHRTIFCFLFIRSTPHFAFSPCTLCAKIKEKGFAKFERSGPHIFISLSPKSRPNCTTVKKWNQEKKEIFLESVEGFSFALVIVVGLGVIGFIDDLQAFDSFGVFGVAVNGYEYAV